MHDNPYRAEEGEATERMPPMTLLEIAIRNEDSASIAVYIEPWAAEFGLPPGGSILIRFDSQNAGRPEVAYLPGGIAIYGFPGSMCHVLDPANGSVQWVAHQRLPTGNSRPSFTSRPP